MHIFRISNLIIAGNIAKDGLQEYSWPRFAPNEITNVVSMSCTPKSRILASISEGKVIEWRSSNSPHIMEGLGGITISKVVTGEDNLACFVTDRGILLTKGRGRGGRLGHGDEKDVKDVPKIVEALLGT